MKNTKNKVLAILLPALLALSLTGSVFAASAGDPDLYNFLAGQTIDIGRIEVYNDLINVYITLVIEDPSWEVIATKVVVATELDSIPQTKSGNPKVGHFPYSGLLTFTIPLGDVLPDGAEAGDTLIIAVHSVVQNMCGQCETAWGGPCAGHGSGGDFGGNNWATYMNYLVT